jgi:hypothetical protein
MHRRFAVRRNKKQNGTFICTSCSKEVKGESEVCPYCNEILAKAYKLNLRLFPGIWRLLLALFVFLFYLFPKWRVQDFDFLSDPIANGRFLGELAAVYMALIGPGLKRLKLLPYKEIYLHKDYIGFSRKDNTELVLEEISNIRVLKSKIFISANDEKGVPQKIKIRRKIDVDSETFANIVKDIENYFVQVDQKNSKPDKKAINGR